MQLDDCWHWLPKEHLKTRTSNTGFNASPISTRTICIPNTQGDMDTLPEVLDSDRENQYLPTTVHRLLRLTNASSVSAQVSISSKRLSRNQAWALQKCLSQFANRWVDRHMPFPPTKSRPPVLLPAQRTSLHSFSSDFLLNAACPTRAIWLHSPLAPT